MPSNIAKSPNPISPNENPASGYSIVMVNCKLKAGIGKLQYAFVYFGLYN